MFSRNIWLLSRAIIKLNTGSWKNRGQSEQYKRCKFTWIWIYGGEELPDGSFIYQLCKRTPYQITEKRNKRKRIKRDGNQNKYTGTQMKKNLQEAFAEIWSKEIKTYLFYNFCSEKGRLKQMSALVFKDCR